MQTGLYIVGTPIGNLSDMSPRAIEVLRSADLIAAEDTRVFGKLASHFDIKTPRCAMHDHNERDVVPDLIEKMQHGEKVQCYGYYTDVSGVKWLYVVYKGITGFASSKYLKKK